MENTIPVVDLGEYLSGDSARKEKFIGELGAAYETIGFVAVVNHGIDEALVKKFYSLVEAFFAMPDEVKSRYEIPSLAGQRGYTSFGKEHAKGSTVGDLKEFWQVGQTITDNDPIQSEYPDNLSVNELPEFHTTASALYKAFEESGAHLLRAISNRLNLEENYFDSKIHNGNSILRAIHYPPISGDPSSAIRAEQHEDINLITLLVGASAEGLQVLRKDGQWIPVQSVERQIVVNVGDMLQRLTNNRLRSTTHRVVNPPKEKWHLPRYSIPFFLHPRSDMPLNCLDSCIDNEHPKAYVDMSAGEYLDERLIEIGLKKK